MHRVELPLLGGTANRGLVVRVGDTVRRPLRPTSPATHALLRHLEDVGFDGAPRFLGVDDRGREVLTYVPGHALIAPHPAWGLSDAALRSAVRLLRRYHEAVASFDPGPYAWPPVPPPPYGGGLVTHNDPNLDNVVFRDGEAVALIDFDLASPGSRVWDVAALARLWAPLRQDDDVADLRRGRTLERFRLVVDAYGLDEAERAALPDAVLQNHDWLYEVVTVGASQGNPGFADYLREGGAERAARTRRWYGENRPLLADSLA